jgi:hypothetical protein
MVDPEANKFGTADVFLDDIFSAIPQLDGDSPGDRGAQAALLALDVLGQPLLPDNGESLPRDEVLAIGNLAIGKAIAKGTPAERFIVLGWMIDTRRLLISLPTNKFTAWTANINNILLSKGRRVKLRTLETMRLVVMGTAVAQSVVSVSVVGVDLAVQAIGHLPANVPLDHQGLGGTA